VQENWTRAWARTLGFPCRCHARVTSLLQTACAGGHGGTVAGAGWARCRGRGPAQLRDPHKLEHPRQRRLLQDRQHERHVLASKGHTIHGHQEVPDLRAGRGNGSGVPVTRRQRAQNERCGWERRLSIATQDVKQTHCGRSSKQTDSSAPFNEPGWTASEPDRRLHTQPQNTT
jgi:hypothetical protein